MLLTAAKTDATHATEELMGGNQLGSPVTEWFDLGQWTDSPACLPADLHLNVGA